MGQASTVGVIIPWASLSKQQRTAERKYAFYVRNIVPIGAASAISLFTGNSAYLYLSVPLVQIMKSCTPIMLVLTLYVTNVERPSTGFVTCVVAMSSGIVITNIGERIDSVKLTGVLLSACSSACEVARLLLTQRLLSNVSAAEGLHLVTPMCTLWLFLFSLVHEIPLAIEEDAQSIVRGNWSAFGASMMLAVAVNTSSFMVIKQTSSITLKMLGNARNSGLVLFSVLFLERAKSVTELTGYVISVVSFGMYTYLRHSVKGR
jgi:hypothetical protein